MQHDAIDLMMSDYKHCSSIETLGKQWSCDARCLELGAEKLGAEKWYQGGNEITYAAGHPTPHARAQSVLSTGPPQEQRTQFMLIRKITRRTRGRSLPQIVEELKPYLIGWPSYFGFCETPRVLISLEAWIRRTLRMYLWRQWKSGPKRFKELRRRGVARFLAAVAAGSPTGFWRMSGHPAVQKGTAQPRFRDSSRIYIAN
jgi:group II intron maturase